MTYCAIDVGSTSIKWARFEGTNRTAEGAAAFPAPSRKQPPYFEVDPALILNGVLDAIYACSPVDGILFSVQMHGYVLLNRQGAAITGYISWQDERALQNGIYERYPYEIIPQTGSSKKPNLPVISLYAMQILDPATMLEAHEFCTLGSYLVRSMTGENASHITDLSPTGMYHARTGQVLAQTPLIMPKACAEILPVGQYRGSMVYPAIGDQQASVSGSSIQGDEYLLNLGTAAQICLISDVPAYGDYESRPYFGGKTLCTVTRLLGGRDILRLKEDPLLDELLYASYSDAISRLPVKQRIVAVGGAAQHHHEHIEHALRRIGLPYRFDKEADALSGLIRLAHRSPQKN